MTMPHLTFACELPTPALPGLITQTDVISDLIALEATVSLAILDLSAERAAAVSDLNRAGIPVIAWLLLPRSQGYWFNSTNASEAREAYGDFQEWAATYDLQFERVALDIEPDLREMDVLLHGQRWQVLPRMLFRLAAGEEWLQARLAYGALSREIRQDGYGLDIYHYPFMVDERRANSTVLQRFLGLVDPPADREVLMLYTSFLPGIGPAVLSSYAKDAQVVGVGSTGGGVDIPQPPPLSWDDLERDLRLAYRWTDDIFIFSLEGCQQQDMLPRLREMAWQVPLTMPTAQIERVDGIRRALRAGLWAGMHPYLTLIGLFSLLFAGRATIRALVSSRR